MYYDIFNMIFSKQQCTGLQNKHYKSQFIYKLIDIMKNNPVLVNWIQNGSCIQFFRVPQIQKQILPQYFRHSNFQSFLRQLHLYNFRQNKSYKNRLVFQHQIFRQGNEIQFYNIQRTKKKKQKKQLLKNLENNDILQIISATQILDQSQKEILNVLFSYKFIVLEKQKQLKQRLNRLIQQLRSNRNIIVKQNITLIKEQIKQQMDSHKKFSKSIDIYLKNFLKAEQKAEQEPEFLQKVEKKYKVQTNQENNLLLSKKNDQCAQDYEAVNTEIVNFIKNNESLKEEKSQSNMHKQSFKRFKAIKVQNFIKESTIEKQSQPSMKECEKCQKYIKQESIEKLQYFNSYYCPVHCQIQQNSQINLLNVKNEPSIIFLPLNYYKKSIQSSFFDNLKENSEVKVNEKQEKNKKKDDSFPSKSEQFETSGKLYPSQGGYLQQQQQYQQSEISFMNNEVLE